MQTSGAAPVKKRPCRIDRKGLGRPADRREVAGQADEMRVAGAHPDAQLAEPCCKLALGRLAAGVLPVTVRRFGARAHGRPPPRGLLLRHSRQRVGLALRRQSSGVHRPAGFERLPARALGTRSTCRARPGGRTLSARAARRTAAARVVRKSCPSQGGRPRARGRPPQCGSPGGQGDLRSCQRLSSLEQLAGCALEALLCGPRPSSLEAIESGAQNECRLIARIAARQPRTLHQTCCRLVRNRNREPSHWP